MDVFIRSNAAECLDHVQVNAGDWVVIKPNLVKESKENDPDVWQCVITSRDLIARVCASVCKQLSGKGKVTICDAPQTDSSFAAIDQLLGLQNIADHCTRKYGVPVEIVDLRNEEWTNKNGVITHRRKLSGDPHGAIAFNLGKDSLFFGHSGAGRYYGADYDSSVVNMHHEGDIQEYLICATPILCDVFINLPKLKTHKKTGVTLNLKNLVGINADKNWLPHHTAGAPGSGGDQYPDMSALRRIEQVAVKAAQSLAVKVPALGPWLAQRLRRAGTVTFGGGDKVVRSGNWYGNDTTWRMVLDLNRCLLYGNPDGTLRRNNPKRYYSIVDGVLGMDGSGPMQGNPVDSQVVIGGTDPVAVDMVAARVMGFDWRKIPVIREAFRLKELQITRTTPEEVDVRSDNPGWQGPFLEIEQRDFLAFTPHFAWAGHIEFRRQ